MNLWVVKDWSLITGRGGGKYCYAEEEHIKFWGSFNAGA